MLKKILSLFVVLFPILGAAETITLLQIPMYDKSDFNYTVSAPNQCSFKGVGKINHPNLYNSITDKPLDKVLSETQREANLELDKQNISDDLITFSLKGASNIMFEFAFKDCKLTRTVVFDNEKYPIEAIHAEYKTTLKNPVLEKLTVKTGLKDHPDLVLYQWALHDHVPVYSFDMGPGLQIRTNIRKNDQTTFHKSNPAIGPIPVFSGNYGPLFINRSGAGSLVFSSGEFNVLLMGVLEGEPYKTPGLNDRNDGVFLGSVMKYHFLELTYYNDFFDERGYQFKVNVAPKFYITPAWRVTPQAFVQYWDNKYVDYYFGVTPGESAASQLASYKGKHTLNYGSVLELMHFDGRWTYVNELTLKLYGKEVYSSPTVAKKDEVKFITSVLYKFF